jgi:myo-inositol 2-dehydrogenase/D-chiro-inositol 1-dehydrogenase
MKIGVIGTGRIGKLHISALKKLGCPFLYAYDADVAAASDPLLADIFVSSIDALFAKGLDGVIIASPSNLHIEHVKLAAEKGVDIFCEKPLGLDLEEIDQALKITKQANVKLQVGFNRRFDENFSQLKKAISTSNETPHVIKITSRDPGLPSAEYIKKSGGLFMDMMIHDLDMACFLADAKPVSIHVMASCLVDPAIREMHDVDTALAMIKFENGIIASIDNCRHASYGYDQRVEVYNHQEIWSVNNCHQNAIGHWDKDGYHQGQLQNFFMQRYQGAYFNQIKHFVDCLKNNTSPLVNGEDGRLAVQLAQAALQSYQQQIPIMGVV